MVPAEGGLEEALALASQPEEDAVFCCGGALTLSRPLKIYFEAQVSPICFYSHGRINEIRNKLRAADQLAHNLCNSVTLATEDASSGQKN